MGPMAGDLGPIWISGAGGGLGSRGELGGSDMMVLRYLGAMLDGMGEVETRSWTATNEATGPAQRERFPAVSVATDFLARTIRP